MCRIFCDWFDIPGLVLYDFVMCDGTVTLGMW